MTAPRLSAYQGFIIAAGELYSVLTAAAASPPPPERFMAAVSDAVATIDRAYSGLLLVASQDALTAAAEIVQTAHRIREFLDPYQRSPHGLGELTQEYASACNAFTRTARDEVGNERSLSGRGSLTCGNTVLVMRACGCLPVSACWRGLHAPPFTPHSRQYAVPVPGDGPAAAARVRTPLQAMRRILTMQWLQRRTARPGRR